MLYCTSTGKTGCRFPLVYSRESDLSLNSVYNYVNIRGKASAVQWTELTITHYILDIPGNVICNMRHKFQHHLGKYIELREDVMKANWVELKVEGMALVVHNPRVNSAQNGQVGRLRVGAASRYQWENERTISAASIEKYRYKHKCCGWRNNVHTFTEEIVMKHLLVMIQYAGENNNVTTKIATISMNNITGTAEHIDNLNNLHTVIWRVLWKFKKANLV